MAHTLLIRLVYSEEKDVQGCCLDWTKHLQCIEAFFISRVQYSLKHLTDPRMKTYSSEAQSRLFAVCIPPIYNWDNKPNMVCREGSASVNQPWMFQCQSDIHMIYYAHVGGGGSNIAQRRNSAWWKKPNISIKFNPACHTNRLLPLLILCHFGPDMSVNPAHIIVFTPVTWLSFKSYRENELCLQIKCIQGHRNTLKPLQNEHSTEWFCEEPPTWH